MRTILFALYAEQDESDRELKEMLEKYTVLKKEDENFIFSLNLNEKDDKNDNTNFYIDEDGTVYFINPDKEKAPIFSYIEPVKPIENINLPNIALFKNIMRQKEDARWQSTYGEDLEVTQAFAPESCVSPKISQEGTETQTLHTGGVRILTPRDSESKNDDAHTLLEGTQDSFSGVSLDVAINDSLKKLAKAVIDKIQSYKPTTSSRRLGFFSLHVYKLEDKEGLKTKLINLLAAIKDNTQIGQDDQLSSADIMKIKALKGGTLYTLINDTLSQAQDTQSILSSYEGNNSMEKFLSSVLSNQALLPRRPILSC